MLGFLMVMGGFRRSLIPLLGYTETDPLLLVSPVAATICFVNLAINRQLRPSTQLGKWIMGLMACMGLAVLNPLQGNPLVGLTGAAFYLVPLMWYCIGRNVGTPQIVKTISQIVLFASVMGAIYGLKQHFFGFSAADNEWFKLSKFTLQVGGTQRPMSFYTSPAEYANFLSLGIIVCFCNYLRGQRVYVLLALFLAYALFMTGIRGNLLSCVGSCTLMWAIQGREIRQWIPRVVAAAVIVGVGGVLGLQQIGTVAESVGGGSSGAEMVTHQVEGLTDPLAEDSSVHGHLNLIATGILGGIKMPIGYGLGATTMGSGRFGGSASFSAEIDIANMFYSLGIAGGIAFIGVIVTCFRAAALYWYHTRAYAPLLIIGALASSNGNWLTAGHYSQAALVWILIGCLDRSWRDGRAVPGFKPKLKQNKTAAAIWRRALDKRLRGVTPSWEATYLRASQQGAAPASQLPLPLVDDSAKSVPVQPTRLTPSAERALARAARESETEWRRGSQEHV
jgi:hypothetical protein